MKKIYLLALFFLTLSSHAQMTPVGSWHSVDDETKEVKAEIMVTEQAGVLSGKIVKFLKLGADLTRVCTKCDDDRKDKPILGMEILRGAKKVAQKNVWDGGKILDPEKGSSYTLRLTPIEDGKKLEVRGSIAFFSKTQTWIRVSPSTPSN